MFFKYFDADFCDLAELHKAEVGEGLAESVKVLPGDALYNVSRQS